MKNQLLSSITVLSIPVILIFQAYEKRFPTCKMIPVFLGSDIMAEFKSKDGAEHVVERRCRLNVDAPYILKKASWVFVYYKYKQFDANNRHFRRCLFLNAVNCTTVECEVGIYILVYACPS